MWTRFNPCFLAIEKAILHDNVIGDIRCIYSDNSLDWHNKKPDSTRMLSAEQAGGSVLDLGPYPLVYVSGTVPATSLPLTLGLPDHDAHVPPPQERPHPARPGRLDDDAVPYGCRPREQRDTHVSAARGDRLPHHELAQLDAQAAPHPDRWHHRVSYKLGAICRGMIGNLHASLGHFVAPLRKSPAFLGHGH